MGDRGIDPHNNGDLIIPPFGTIVTGFEDLHVILHVELAMDKVEVSRHLE